MEIWGIHLIPVPLSVRTAAPMAQVAVEVEAEPAAADTILCIKTLSEGSLTREAVVGVVVEAAAGVVTQVATGPAAVVRVTGISAVATPDGSRE